MVADDTVAASEIGVDVSQPDAPAVEASTGVEIEKDRAAPHEGFDIAIELRRVIVPQDWQKLALTPCPLQQGAGRRKGAVGQVISRYRICTRLTIDP
jgi:hypothetical protein